MSKHIKNFILLMVALVATTAFAACGDDDDDQGGTSVSGLKLTESTLTFTRQGGTLTFSAQAPTQVTATSDQAWCTVTPGTMSANLKVTPITVSVTLPIWGMSYIWADRLLEAGIPVEFFVPVRTLLAGVLLLILNRYHHCQRRLAVGNRQRDATVRRRTDLGYHCL